ncbi:MAG: ferrous iron transport protein B [Anaerolineales bacterium]|nr:ferrous iron transport protein B [Chloroflexota bacterium]MBL6980414.1 ferrous iron transport protein B [Anaerolineales bacterium]
MSIIETALQKKLSFKIDYGEELEEQINQLVDEIAQRPVIAEQFPHRWLAIKLLEEDRDIQIKLLALKDGASLIKVAQKSIELLKSVQGDDLDIQIADRRYRWINQLVNSTVQRPLDDKRAFTDRFDQIVTHRYLGIPIFFIVMWIVFKLTADVSAPYIDWIDGVITGPIGNMIVAILNTLGLRDSWVSSLFVDGIVAGVGGVLVFVPVLTFLYLALAVLEDTGYMARGAYVMDRVMGKIGLHGKSFLPMLVGFGCTVPAFYSTRTLENEKDRILTGLLVPFMSCGARLPVYILFSAIFFPRYAGTAVFSMYLLGILTAIGLGIILRKTVFKNKEQSALIIELPPYRAPNVKTVWLYIKERVGTFLKNAWTIIMATSIVLWLLLAIPVNGQGSFAETDVDHSVFATVNRVVAPILKPLGFGNWQASGSLITGFLAKEVVVSTMAQIYTTDVLETNAESNGFLQEIGEIIFTFWGATVDTLKSLPLIVGVDLFEEEVETEPTNLMNAIYASFDASSGGHGVFAGLAFMVFVLIYTPCVVAVAAERQELGTKWMWVSMVGQLVLAWIMALAVFQGGKLLFG